MSAPEKEQAKRKKLFSISIGNRALLHWGGKSRHRLVCHVRASGAHKLHFLACEPDEQSKPPPNLLQAFSQAIKNI